MSRFKLLLKILVTGLVIVWLTRIVNGAELFDHLRRLNPLHLLLAWGVYLFLQFISAVRWQRFAQDLGVNVPVPTMYRYYLSALFWGLFLPTAIGGDVARAAMVTREHQASWVTTSVSIFAERLVGVIAMLIWALLGIVLYTANPERLYTSWHPAFGLVELILTGSLIFAYGFHAFEKWPWGRWVIAKLLPAEQEALNSGKPLFWPTPWSITRGIGYSLLYQAGVIGLHGYLLQCLGVSIPLASIPIAYGLGSLAGLLPAISGVGPREGTMIFFLHLLAGVSMASATALSVSWLGILTLSALTGGLLILIRWLFPINKQKTDTKRAL